MRNDSTIIPDLILSPSLFSSFFVSISCLISSKATCKKIRLQDWLDCTY